MPNNVTVHPAVFADQRRVDALQANTGRRIVIDGDTGRAHLAQPAAPITRMRIASPLTNHQRSLIRENLENAMRNTLTNLAGYTAGHDPKGAA